MTKPHEILGVERDADFDTIKCAYLKLAKTAHPDGGGRKEDFVQLQLAFELMARACDSESCSSPLPNEEVAEGHATQDGKSEPYEEIVQGVWESLEREFVQPNHRRDARSSIDFWYAIILTPLCAGTIATCLCYDESMPLRSNWTLVFVLTLAVLAYVGGLSSVLNSSPVTDGLTFYRRFICVAFFFSAMMLTSLWQPNNGNTVTPRPGVIENARYAVNNAADEYRRNYLVTTSVDNGEEWGSP